MYQKLTPAEREAIERRMLIEMAGRYGALLDRSKRERQEGQAAAIAAAKKNARREDVA